MTHRRASCESELPAPLRGGRVSAIAVGPKSRRLRGVIAASGLSVLLLRCGGGDSASSPQPSAAETAAAATCDLFRACGEIGAGKLYDDTDQCKLTERAHWDMFWPSSDCDGRINQAQLTTCVTTVREVDCSSASNWIVLVAGNCTRNKICMPLPDASAQ